MSTQMPSLFDELEFFGPKPQKEVKKTKKKESKPTEKPIEEKVYSNDILKKEENLVAESEQESYTIEESEAIKPEENKKGAIEDSFEKEAEKEDILQEQELQKANELNKENRKESEIQNSGEKIAETALTTASSNLHISFEAPEEESFFFTGNELEELPPLEKEEENIPKEQAIEQLPIPGIKEERVDDLDNLLRSSIISQDYALYAGLDLPKEEKEQKFQVKLEEESKEEEEKLTVESEKNSDLVFEFETEAPLEAETLPGFDLEDKYYTIGEVASLFSVNVSHIRFWTSEFKLKVRTTRKGDRLYNPENIARLRLIHHLVKENGFTIKGAKEKLKLQKSNVSSQVDLKEKLTGLREKLERIKRNL